MVCTPREEVAHGAPIGLRVAQRLEHFPHPAHPIPQCTAFFLLTPPLLSHFARRGEILSRDISREKENIQKDGVD